MRFAHSTFRIITQNRQACGIGLMRLAIGCEARSFINGTSTRHDQRRAVLGSVSEAFENIGRLVRHGRCDDREKLGKVEAPTSGYFLPQEMGRVWNDRGEDESQVAEPSRLWLSSVSMVWLSTGR